MSIISDKTESIRRWQAGEFGNLLLSWPDLDAYKASGYSGDVVLRYKGTGGGGWCAYGAPQENVDATVAQWLQEGAERGRIYVNESQSDEGLVIQGEVMRSADYFSLRYSTLKKKMRDALAEDQKHVGGLSAVLILRSCLDNASWEQLNHLFDVYPDSVIEFSTWDHPIGDMGWNTVIWEVRNY